jgi:predicted tellurium resistance membrane protein TerC
MDSKYGMSLPNVSQRALARTHAYLVRITLSFFFITCLILQNPLVVFSSNIFAILGLRSLYTILSKAATDLKYLEPAVAVVLGFIGGKMIAEYFGYNIPTDQALAVVATLLGSGVGLSVWDKQKDLGDPPDEE